MGALRVPMLPVHASAAECDVLLLQLASTRF